MQSIGPFSLTDNARSLLTIETRLDNGYSLAMCVPLVKYCEMWLLGVDREGREDVEMEKF